MSLSRLPGRFVDYDGKRFSPDARGEEVAMLILPAIDLRGGRCVRLRQGDYSQETIFGDDPVAIARRWVELGAETLHLVDLDGARAGHPVNGEVVRKIVDAAKVPCQLGGGLRSEEDIEAAFSWGVERVVLGTRALQDPLWCRQVIFDHPKRIVLGLDARGGKVATHGWINVSEASALDMAKQFAAWPVAAIVYTDITRDGMLTGPNVPLIQAIVDWYPHVALQASGGVAALDDLATLAQSGADGAIVGKALWEGRFTVAEALVAGGLAYANG